MAGVKKLKSLHQCEAKPLVLAILVLLIYGVVYGTSKQKKYPLLIGNIGCLGLEGRCWHQEPVQKCEA